MEDKIANIRQDIEEVKSCLGILQQAIQNEYNIPENRDIDNTLEIIINKLTSTIDDIREVEKYTYTK